MDSQMNLRWPRYAIHITYSLTTFTNPSILLSSVIHLAPTNPSSMVHILAFSTWSGIPQFKSPLLHAFILVVDVNRHPIFFVELRPPAAIAYVLRSYGVGQRPEKQCPRERSHSEIIPAEDAHPSCACWKESGRVTQQSTMSHLLLTVSARKAVSTKRMVSSVGYAIQTAFQFGFL